MSWPMINEKHKTRVPNILEVFDLLLSLPAGTSECERGFSQMKLTKTEYRNKLKSHTMTMLMTVQLHSDTISSYDPTPAIHQWNSCHHRRPSFMDRRRETPREAYDRAVEEAEVVEPESEMEEAAAVAESAAAAVLNDSDYDSDFSDLDSEYSDADV